MQMSHLQTMCEFVCMTESECMNMGLFFFFGERERVCVCVHACVCVLACTQMLCETEQRHVSLFYIKTKW